jgi:FlaA1/EpsC-like NDP-sugar epimerase/lipopolysaccharide/colanic/teichoic acid biosynthesis glycosyltransferase
MIKRIFDLSLASVAFLLALPLSLIIGIVIRLDSPGPIIFKQVRIGRGLRPFSIYKFRTMVLDAHSMGGQLTIGEDVRVTRVGRMLRRYKLDELPQLFNIVKGDMSFVGPRPEVERYVRAFRTDFSEILSLRPGLTDLASLRYIDEAGLLARAGNAEEEYVRAVLPEKIRLARLYLRHASFSFDLAIISQTLLRLAGLPMVLCEVPEPGSTRTSGWNWAFTIPAWVLRWRRPIVIVLDIGMIVLANFLAFWLRFDGDIPHEEYRLFVTLLPWLLAIRAVAFMLFSLNEGLWRYTSIWDLKNIMSGVLLSSVAFYGLVFGVMGLTHYPRSVFMIDALLLIGFVTGIRLPFRFLREGFIYRHKKKVLIIGAGDTGERVVREMKTNRSSAYEPVGFIDDEVSLLNKRIHGVKVCGTRRDLPKVLAERQAEEVILALSNARPALLREIISSLEPFKVSIKTLPGMQELLNDRSAVSQMRSVAWTDLLPRAPINLQADGIRQMITGQRVLITGAGGSIGSELARQVAALKPDRLVLYERHENSLYTIAKELEDQGESSCVVPVLGDVTDVQRLTSTLSAHRPTIFFHAAAHKHVPLVELNPAEALKNNCLGTRIAAEVAHNLGVERFVLISTDKAVNPSSVMGATKRVAELIVQSIARRSRTRFITVRFGNVLGSNGSVLLRFQEQIQAGGPVTVTHPGVRRYFMLIPEAVHLVLQAASLGEQGATYILDMGEQIPVLTLARHLIRLSGFVPDKEISIRFVGLRPGEKLAEELVGDGEIAQPSSIEKILRIRPAVPVNLAVLHDNLMALEAAAHLNKTDWALDRLRELVPEFQSPCLMPGPAASAPMSTIGERVAH